jgi:hypothetical protein
MYIKLSKYLFFYMALGLRSLPSHDFQGPPLPMALEMDFPLSKSYIAFVGGKKVLKSAGCLYVYRGGLHQPRMSIYYLS